MNNIIIDYDCGGIFKRFDTVWLMVLREIGNGTRDVDRIPD